MNFSWKHLSFALKDEILYLTRFGNMAFPEDYRGSLLAEVQVEGGHKNSHSGAKAIFSSEGSRAKYVSHEATDDRLTVVMRSPVTEIRVIFEAYGDCNTLRIHTEVTNVTDSAIKLEEVSAFTLTGIGGPSPMSEDIYFTRFVQNHHRECQPRRLSLFDLGLHTEIFNSAQCRVAFANVGSWSTKECLPQGILEDEKNGGLLMFQIESNHSWYYEISDYDNYLYLYLGGATNLHCGWSMTLESGDTFRTENVAIAIGDTLNGLLGEMTKYRRHIAGNSPADESLPAIFNEYMHFSWDSPSAETTRIAAPVVAEMGADCYVIDCGWHNEEPGSEVYPYVGHWKESHARFPLGVRETTDFIRSLGMKPGLWIEPEIIGQQCEEMLNYYDDDCFLRRGGKKIAVMNRYFLDYRAPKVIAYMNETIRRMVEDYGAEYIKFDYNQDLGIGVDDEDGFGEGLRQSAEAYLNWAEAQVKKYPHVIFEGCSSGGMRMDYKTLSRFSLVSTSDQISYQKYPYIAGNILAAVLPEQAAVWAYPVADGQKNEDVSRDCVIMNMINSFLGRIHLASRLFELDEEKKALVKEGVAYYKSLTTVKKRALPYLPLGFTDFRKEMVASGFVTDNTLYLAVWHLKGDKTITVPIPEGVKTAKIAYPSASDTALSVSDTSLTLTFPREEGAAFLEVALK